jgi:hypothetical protein
MNKNRWWPRASWNTTDSAVRHHVASPAGDEPVTSNVSRKTSADRQKKRHESLEDIYRTVRRTTKVNIFRKTVVTAKAMGTSQISGICSSCLCTLTDVNNHFTQRKVLNIHILLISCDSSQS